jgi:hypothetical protein
LNAHLWRPANKLLLAVHLLGSVFPQDGLMLEEEVFMLHKCANSACQTSFRKLTEGKLFLVETGELDLVQPQADWERASHRRIEHYWLCDQCASSLTLVYERGRGVVAILLDRSLLKKRALPESFRGEPLRGEMASEFSYGNRA